MTEQFKNLVELRKDAIAGLLITVDAFRENVNSFHHYVFNYRENEDYDLLKTYIEAMEFKLHNIQNIEEQIREAGREP